MTNLGQLVAKTTKIDLPVTQWVSISSAVAVVGCVMAIGVIANPPNERAAYWLFLVLGLVLLVTGIGLLIKTLTQKPWELSLYQQGLRYQRGTDVLEARWSEIADLRVFISKPPLYNYKLKLKNGSKRQFFLVDGEDTAIMQHLERLVPTISHWLTLTRRAE